MQRGGADDVGLAGAGVRVHFKRMFLIVGLVAGVFAQGTRAFFFFFKIKGNFSLPRLN